MLTVEQLDEMSQTELKGINYTELVNIQNVQIDTSLPLEQRILNYIEQVKNPYCFLCDDSIVRVRFEPTGEDLKGKLKNYFISLKKV